MLKLAESQLHQSQLPCQIFKKRIYKDLLELEFHTFQALVV